MTTVKHKVHFQAGRRSKKVMAKGVKPASPPVERVPRIARLMALAIKFDQMIQSGQVKDQAELARLGHVSRARLTQIMNLLNLAPDLQEELLFASTDELRRIAVREHQVRSIAQMTNWGEQKDTIICLCSSRTDQQPTTFASRFNGHPRYHEEPQ